MTIDEEGDDRRSAWEGRKFVRQGADWDERIENLRREWRQEAKARHEHRIGLPG